MLSLNKCILFAVALFSVAIAETATAQEPPFELPEHRELLKIRSAILETSKGKLFIELFPEEAPWHVANFKYLADRGFYKNVSFHLFEPDYLIQGGAPLKNGRGGPGYSIPAEFSARNHTFGTLGMARRPDTDVRTGKETNPERRSHGSQFHLILGDAPHMDGQYTIFGKVVGGFETLRELRAGDTILKLTVFVRNGGR